MGGHYEKDIMKQLQEVLARCDKLEQKVDDTKRSWKKEVKQIKADFAVERRQLKSEIKELKTENKKLREEFAQANKTIVNLEQENSKLRSHLNNDSTNSSLPPSTDQKGTNGRKKANEYNGRTKSKKNAGGQDGHNGTTLRASYVREKINAGDLERRIVDIGDIATKYTIRYMLDYEIKPIVKELRFHADKNGKINIPAEYRNEVVYGNIIKAICVHLYSEGVVANDRICEFVNALCNGVINISNGSVYNMIKSFSSKCDGEIEEIKKELLSSEVLYTDATVVTVNGKQTYIRNQSTDNVVLYNCMSSKSIEAIKENTILGIYNGIVVHDHETAMYSFGAGHGECNAHLLRYLKKNTEETNNKWSVELTALFAEMNDARKAKTEKGEWFTMKEIESYEKRYDKIIKKGLRENNRTSSKYAKEEEAALLRRLVAYKENHLLFIHDNRVKFDNNMSERDLRKCKNRQKMAGGFRKTSGKEMYCKILSVIETAKRKGEKIFEKITEILHRQSIVPA